MQRIVILGGGTGGTLTANRLRRVYSPDQASITVVDKTDDHVYQPGLLFVPFGLTNAEDIVRPRGRQIHRDIEYHTTAVESVDIEAKCVALADGTELHYEVLVIATGSVLAPEETEGLLGPGWMEKVFTFYTREGASALCEAFKFFDGGRIVVNVVDMPIKCPVAPLEFCFLADWFFHEAGIRDRVELTYVTPLDGAFTQPVASRTLGGMLEQRGIELVTEFNTAKVSGDAGHLVSWDNRLIPFDLAVIIPAHSGSAYVANSPGLGDELGFVPADEHTLQSKARPDIFVIGDAAALPISKAGSVTHFEGEVLVANIQRYLADEPLEGSYDGHVNCFIETGFSKAMLIDFNYDTEPVAGHFPGPVGLPLLKESYLNHLGKLMFQWMYWHSLLPGRDIPGITSSMPRRGKHPAQQSEEADAS